MILNQEQEGQILQSYKILHHMLQKLAKERNDHILPQLGLDCIRFPKVTTDLHDGWGRDFRLPSTALIQLFSDAEYIA